MKKNEDKKQQQMTFSKKWMSRILFFSLVWISLSYVLAFLDKAEIAQELSVQIVIVIIATFVPYLIKSYFETKEEEKNKIINNQLNINKDTEDEEEVETEYEEYERVIEDEE